MSDGFHVLPGTGAGNVLSYASKLGVIKCLDNSWWVCNEAKRLNPGTITIARTLVTDYGMIDCPQEWNWQTPSAWWGAIKNRLPDGFDYYEVINECWLPPQGAAHLAWWSIEIAKLVQQDKNGALLAFSFSAGSPDYPDWPALLPYLLWAENNPLPDGRRHGIALHAAAYATWTRADSPWIGNAHLNPDRYYLFAHDVILANTGVDVNRLHIPVVWTEIGIEDGYASGVIGGPQTYSCEEKADAYRETVKRIENRGAIAWWNFGQISRWHSDHACLPLMFP